MNKFQAKKAGLERRKRRVRGKVTGTADRPRHWQARRREGRHHGPL